MARVTKINVGGTNYDIAHEGELKNSGFEVVTSLPTTGLFEGREVVCQGKKYVYSIFYRGWVIAFDEKKEPVYNVMKSRYNFEILGYDYSLYRNTINRSYLSNYSNYLNLTDDYLIEVSTDNETFTEIDRGNKAYQIFNAINSEGWSVLNYKSVRFTIGYGSSSLEYIVSLYINCYKIKINRVIVEQQPPDSEEWATLGEINITEAENPHNNETYIALDMYSFGIGRDFYKKIRITIDFEPKSTAAVIYNLFLLYEGNKFLNGINNYFKLSYKLLDCYSTVDYPITLNYDVSNIEPTQTGEVEKKANWVLRYLLQGVNWLKANKVALSVYNAKVAELMQADSANNAYIQSVKEELTALIDEVSGGLANLAAVARSGSYNDLTDTPTLADVATSGDYNDLLNKPTFSGSYNDLTDKPTLADVATSGDYNDLLNKPTFSGSYNDLTDTPTIPSTFADLNGNIDAANQIGDGEIAISKLANSSMTLNGITVSLGGQFGLPWQISWNSTLYKARIMGNWLQIYHNNQWVDTFYLLRQEPIQPIQPTNVLQITSLRDLSWYDERVSEYEIDSNTTFDLLDGKVFIAGQLINCPANQLTLNLYPIPSGRYNKGALDSVISDLKGKNFAVFVENDLDTILTSGNDFCVRIKISKVPTYKAIIECYVAR